MANNSDTSSDERAQRIAELKKKMQDAAKKAKADQAAKAAAAAEPQVKADAAVTADEPATAEVAADAKSLSNEPVVEAPVAAEPAVAEPISAAAAEPPPEEQSAAEEPPGEPEPAVETTTAAVVDVFPSNGDNPVAESVVTASVFKNPDEITSEMAANRQMNRREFLTYTWGAALGLATLQVGLVSFFFMYPRFKAGEFGGAFFMGPESATPPPTASPEAVSAGKFWWLTVEDEGPRAIYMVCTHLGCLYKWVEETYRFECPCHGSKFTREGNYIEGPAPRSLDQFVVDLVDNVYVVDTGAKITGAPASESPDAESAT